MKIVPNKPIAKGNPNIIDDCNIIEQQLNSILEEHDCSFVCWSGVLYIFDHNIDQIIGEVKF